MNGPTTGASHSGPMGDKFVSKVSKLPVFDWEATERAVGQELLHQGMPSTFDFKFERMTPDEGQFWAGCVGDGGEEDGSGAYVVSS